MEEQKKFVYGHKGLADLLNISINRAYLLTKNGQLDGATIMRGSRKRMYNADKVLELLTLENLKKTENDGK